MFLGYQKGKITFISDSKEALENMACIVLDKIEESEEEIVLTNEGYRKKNQIDRSELNKVARAERRHRFKEETDLFLFEHLEKMTDISELPSILEEWKKEKNRIRSEIEYI